MCSYFFKKHVFSGVGLSIQIPMLSPWTELQITKVVSLIEMNIMCVKFMLLFMSCFLVALLSTLYSIENETLEKQDVTVFSLRPVNSDTGGVKSVVFK